MVEALAGPWLPYIVVLLAAALGTSLSAVYLWQQRGVLGARAGSFVLLAATVWLLAYALQMISPQLPGKVWWNKVQFIGIVITPLAWLVCVCYYTDRARWLTWPVLAALSVVPLVTLVLVFTQPIPGLIWQQAAPKTLGRFTVLNVTHGIGMYIFVVYAYTLLLWSVLIVSRWLSHSYRFYRRQSGFLLLGVITPWLASIFDLSNLSPLPHFELTPVAFAIMGLIGARSLMWLQRRDVAPVAYESIFESLSDGVVVLDAHERVVSVNPAGQSLIGRSHSQVLGQTLSQIWPAWYAQIKSLDAIGDSAQEITLQQGSESHVYDIRLSSLADWRAHLVGRVLVLRDITSRRQMEEDLKRYRDHLEDLARARTSELRDANQHLHRLLQEVNHRVRNNLTAIIGLLYAGQGAGQSAQDVCQTTLEKLANRVECLATVHDMLATTQWGPLPIYDLAHYVIQDALQLLPPGKQVSVVVQPVGLCVTPDQANDLALALNELTLNTIAHTLHDRSVAHVNVAIVADGSNIVCEFRDDGPGYPDDVLRNERHHAGMYLLGIVVQRGLRGELTFYNDGGAVARMAFKSLADVAISPVGLEPETSQSF